MATRLFVGGLKYEINSDQLRELFETVGTVASAEVKSDKFSGQSKGFGFVEMSTDEEAQKAVRELDGKDLMGRKIAVNEARPREDRGPRTFGGNGGGGNDRRY